MSQVVSTEGQAVTWTLNSNTTTTPFIDLSPVQDTRCGYPISTYTVNISSELTLSSSASAVTLTVVDANLEKTYYYEVTATDSTGKSKTFKGSLTVQRLCQDVSHLAFSGPYQLNMNGNAGQT